MYRTNVYSFLGALTCALLLLSCQQTNKTERGTDNTTKKEETKDVIKTIRQPVKYSGAFYQITNMGSLDIVFTQGPYNIEVEGPEDEIDKLNIGIDQYVLTVNMKNEEKIDLTQYKTTNHKVTLYVSCPIIKTIALCGTGNFHAVGTIQSDGLQLGIIGTGSIDADTINAERLSLDVTGSGNTNLRQVNTKSTTELLLSGEGHTVCNIN